MIDENKLLHNVSKGDQQAFHLIFNRYKNLVYSYALKVLKSQSSAEDVLHDVFLIIWQHNDLSTIRNFEAYLRVVTRNHVLKIIRRQQLELKVNNNLLNNWNESHNELEETVLLKDSKSFLDKGINLLPPQQKLVYHLCHEMGLKYAEAAKELSISPLTVKTHMQHALRFLRNYLRNYTDIAILILFMNIFN